MAAARTYVDFSPAHSLLEEPDRMVFRVDLSGEGFKKEQLQVQIDNTGRLRISGERRLGGNRWRRFSKDLYVPEGCDAGSIRARLDKDGVLLIAMPRLSSAEPEQQHPKAAQPAGADTGRQAAAGQGAQKPAGHASAQQQPSAPAPAPAPAAESEEESSQDDDDEESEEDAGAAMDLQHPTAAAYGRARDRRRSMVWTIFAVLLALVATALYARNRLMGPSAETQPAVGGQIVSLSDS